MAALSSQHKLLLFPDRTVRRGEVREVIPCHMAATQACLATLQVLPGNNSHGLSRGQSICFSPWVAGEEGIDVSCRNAGEVFLFLSFLLSCWAKPEKALERVHLSPRTARGPGGSDRWLLMKAVIESPIEPWSGVTKTPPHCWIWCQQQTHSWLSEAGAAPSFCWGPCVPHLEGGDILECWLRTLGRFT